jgi:hypothetical protein
LLLQANANPMMRAGMPCSGSDVHPWLRFAMGFGDFVPEKAIDYQAYPQFAINVVACTAETGLGQRAVRVASSLTA